MVTNPHDRLLAVRRATCRAALVDHGEEILRAAVIPEIQYQSILGIGPAAERAAYVVGLTHPDGGLHSG